MNHKEKCKKMKALRKQIADNIGIDLHQTECTYKGECKGTCPRCAQEERTLNKALLSGSVALAGLAVSAITLTGCDSENGNGKYFGSGFNTTTEEVLDGMPVDYIEGVAPMPVEELTGEVAPEIMGMETTNPTENTTEEELAGDVAIIYLDDEFIINVSMNYTNAQEAVIVSTAEDVVTVECCGTKDGKKQLLDTLTFHRNSEYANDSAGNSFYVFDYTDN